MRHPEVQINQNLFNDCFNSVRHLSATPHINGSRDLFGQARADDLNPLPALPNTSPIFTAMAVDLLQNYEEHVLKMVQPATEKLVRFRYAASEVLPRIAAKKVKKLGTHVFKMVRYY